MESIKLKARIDRDGILTVQMPEGVTDVDAEIVVYYDRQGNEDEAVDENGWPIGFFDRTYGALADDPIERPPELPPDIRDEIE